MGRYLPLSNSDLRGGTKGMNIGFDGFPASLLVSETE
jgi:hypothetical protein